MSPSKVPADPAPRKAPTRRSAAAKPGKSTSAPKRTAAKPAKRAKPTAPPPPSPEVAAFIAGLARISDADLQRVFAAAVHLYSVRIEEGEKPFRPFPPGVLPATTTDVIVTTTEMLRAVNIQLFELAMWQASNARF